MKTFKASENDDLELLLALSLLSRRTVEVRFDNEDRSIMELLNLLSKITAGTTFEIRDGILTFTPGALTGGRLKVSMQNICSSIKTLMIVAPFMKATLSPDHKYAISPFSLSVEGITNENDKSIDMLKIAYTRLCRTFEVPGFAINIQRRGFGPQGGGRVDFEIGTVNKLKAISHRALETIDQIRGLVVTSRISADFTQRMVGVIKEEMGCLGNVKVATSLHNKADAGPSPGYECSVYVESKNGIFYQTVTGDDGPEETARACCSKLLCGIDRGGILDAKLLPVASAYMALAWGVSYLQVGKLEEETKSNLELLRSILGIEYYITQEADGCVVKVVGCRFINPSRIA